MAASVGAKGINTPPIDLAIGKSFFSQIRRYPLTQPTNDDALTFLGQVTELMLKVSKSDDLSNFARELQIMIGEGDLKKVNSFLNREHSLFNDGSFFRKVDYLAYQQGIRELQAKWPEDSPNNKTLKSIDRTITTDLKAKEALVSSVETFKKCMADVAASQGYPPHVLQADKVAAARVPPPPTLPAVQRLPSVATAPLIKLDEEKESTILALFKRFMTFISSFFLWLFPDV